MNSRTRFSLAWVVLALGLLVGPWGSTPLQAAESDHLVIEMDYAYVTYDPSVPTGSFVLSGGHEDAGTCVQESSVTNDDGSFTMFHSLIGQDGTILIRLDVGAAAYGLYYPLRRMGTFVVVQGWGAYAGLEGQGELLVGYSYEGGYGLGWGGWIPAVIYASYAMDTDPPPNLPPVAGLYAYANFSTVDYVLDAYGSWDDDGMPVRFEWDFDGDGTWDADTGNLGITGHAYAVPGTYDPVVRVTDDDGASDTASWRIVVLPPPTVSLTAPSANGTVAGTSILVAAHATNASYVSFAVDGISIGWDAQSPYEVSWDSTSVADGAHNLTATAIGDAGATATDTIVVHVANGPPPPPPLAVQTIAPDTMAAGDRVSVVVTGTGFQPGATLTFANGPGATPVAANIDVTSTTQLTAQVKAGKKGPKGARVWDVVVHNPDGEWAVLQGGFTVVR